MDNVGIVMIGLRHDGPHDGVLQGNECLCRLDLINRLDLVDKYLLKGVD